MANETNTKTFLDDAESLKALVDLMPEDEREAYKSYGSMSLESAFPGRKMVVYTLHDKQPTDIVVITFGAFMCNWELGPNAEVADSRGQLQIGTIPKRYRPRDLFLHIPQNFSLRYKGRQKPRSDVDFVSHYAVLVKTRSKEIHQVESHTYCVTLNKFRERFPDLTIRY
jgi:hypothetical protein